MKKIDINSLMNKPFDTIRSTVSGTISKYEKKYNAFIEIFDMDKVTKKKSGRLKNIPFSIKDNILFKDHKVSCGSNILENYTANYSAYVVEKLLEEGAYVVGRTNMDEFAMGSSTENSAYKITRNPINSDYVPGGSSGGAAASVGLGIVPFALGTDTGGSVRQPASFCGLCGYKPTYGLFSRRGLVALASSFDQIGIIANSIDDIALVTSIMNGKDPYDLSSYLDREINEMEHINYRGINLKGKIVGVLNNFDDLPVSQKVRDAYQKMINDLEKINVTLVNISPPFLEYSIPLYYILSTAEAASNLARYDGIKYGLRREEKNYQKMLTKTREIGFGKEVKKRILLGTYVTAAGYKDEYYKKALKIRALMKKNYEALFSTVDFILLPTAPTPPFKIGEKIDDSVVMYYNDVFTVIPNIIGSPALTLPIYETSEGLPIGMQLIASAKNDMDLLKFSAKLMRIIK